MTYKTLHIHPNFVNMVALCLGITAGWMFYHTDLLHNVYGALLLIMASICKSANSQLSRITGKEYLSTHILGGASSYICFASIYIAICLRSQNQLIPGLDLHWGIGIWLLCLLAGLWAHSSQRRLADYYRCIFLYFQHCPSDFNSYIHLKAMAKKYHEDGKGLSSLFCSCRALYRLAQEHATPEFQLLIGALKRRFVTLEKVPLSFGKDYCKKSLPLMKYANFLSHYGRELILVFSCLINMPWIYPLFECTVMVYACSHMHHMHNRICKRLRYKLDDDNCYSK